MKQHSVRRVVRVAVLTGFVLQGATLAIAALTWNGRTGSSFISSAAAFVMVVTLALQATFVVVQQLPNGRALVPVFASKDDGWTLVILSTGLPGVFWHTLGTLAGPPMSQIMPGFATPLFLSLLLLIGRQVQLSRATTTTQD